MSLFGSGSAMWLVNRERLVLLGGPAAAVLQVAHPAVAMGVVRHSAFRSDALGRLRRTLDAVYAVAFGGEQELLAVRRGVEEAHRRVRGPGYSAFDPAAQLWVLATLTHASASLFERFVRPLTALEKDRLLDDNRRFGEVFGPGGGLLPAAWCEFESYWQEMMSGPLLASVPECGLAARAVLKPLSPWWLRALAPVFSALANEWIPLPLRQRLELPETALQQPLWRLLDRMLPALLPAAPEALRFAPQYLEARRREQGLTSGL